MTIIEKIFSRGAGRDVRPGEDAWVDLDLVVMRDFGGPNVIQEYEAVFDGQRVYDHSRVAITFDLHVPARNEQVALNQHLLRNFARQQGIHLFDVNTGVGQHILLEHGLVTPGDVIVGTDSHMNLLGAVGAAGFGMGTTDIAGAMYKGKLWFRVPATIKVEINGTPQDRVEAKDIILYVLRRMKTDGALNRAVEFTGNTVAAMDLAERITLCSMVTEMSGDIGFVEPGPGIVRFVESRTSSSVRTIRADEDAAYDDTLQFTVDDLIPQIACPHSPDNVKDITEVQGTKIDQVFIGSCTNGRFEDLQNAAEVLRGRAVSKDMRLIIVPATMEVARQALAEGLYEIFLNAGAVVTNPGCALCTTGHPGILAPGETMVSTSNRNFIGKLGKGGNVFLASPASAAAAALAGEIVDPRRV